MVIRRKSIKLLAHERRILIELYLRWRIPVSQFKSRPEDKQAFVDEWNQLSQRQDAPEDVIHYMRTQRKRALWVRMDGEHTKPPPKPKFTAEETEILVDIYRDNVALAGFGSDVIDHDNELADLLTKLFNDQTGRLVSPDQIKTKLTALRKRGLLPKAETLPPGDGKGFSDIDKISQ